MVINATDRARVLCALYNAAKPQGMGFLAYRPGDLTVAEAEALLSERAYFDYIHGRVIKVALPIEGGEVDLWLYDRGNGAGAGERAIRRALAQDRAA